MFYKKRIKRRCAFCFVWIIFLGGHYEKQYTYGMEPEIHNAHTMRNALIFSIAIILCIGGYFYYTRFFQKKIQNPDEPKKTEYGTALPQDFPREFLSEVSTPLEQSYVLEYPDQKQETIVFESARSLEENQKIYADYLTSNKWLILANSFDEKTVSFYATKESMEMNILIFFDESVATNKVSISVLNTSR